MSVHLERGSPLHRVHRTFGIGLATTVAALALAGAAPAQSGRLPEDNAGTGQYVEPVPDAGGDRPAGAGTARGNRRGGGGTSSGGASGGDDAVLRRIASDPGAGAPAGEDGSGRSGGGAARTRSGDGAAGDGGDDGPIAAAKSAVVDSDDPTLAIVLLSGLGLTLAAAGVAVRRRRRASQ
ncbi:MAG TPA: hypothetical protein VF520_06550 [Thermoleophilaceae bacterium]|jgi:hypothetical protein